MYCTDYDDVPHNPTLAHRVPAGRSTRLLRFTSLPKVLLRVRPALVLLEASPSCIAARQIASGDNNQIYCPRFGPTGIFIRRYVQYLNAGWPQLNLCFSLFATAVRFGLRSAEVCFKFEISIYRMHQFEFPLTALFFVPSSEF